MRKRKRDSKDQQRQVPLKRRRELDEEEKARALPASQPEGSESEAEEEEEEEWQGAESQTEMDEGGDLTGEPHESPYSGDGFEFLPPGGEVSRNDMLIAQETVLSEAVAFEDILSDFVVNLDELFGTGRVDEAAINAALGQIAGFEPATAPTRRVSTDEEEEEEVSSALDIGREPTSQPFAQAGIPAFDEEGSLLDGAPRLETAIHEVESLYIEQTAREIVGDGLTKLLHEVITDISARVSECPPDELRLLILSNRQFNASLDEVKRSTIRYLTDEISDILEQPGMVGS